MGTVKGVEKSVEFAVFHESDSQLWKKDLHKKDYGVDKYFPGRSSGKTYTLYTLDSNKVHSTCKHNNIRSNRSGT